MQSEDKNFSFDPDLESTRQAGSKSNNDDQDIEFVGEIARSSIGRFDIIRQLGKGGFGFVYLAVDPTLNRKVAIKVPRWDRKLSRNAIQRFQVEGRMLAQVNHASIVSVYDVAATEDGIPFVVMEYVQGETLSSILKQKSLTLVESLGLLLAIAEALKQAHKSGLVHRDFKPANVIIKDDGNIYLVDFGLALHDDLSPAELQDGSIAGTPSYMAPEQLRGENHLIGGQTDIWAFGVTMYRMLVGTLPFKGRSKELSRAIRYKNPRPLRQLNDQIPRQLECICLRCLQKLMEDRYQSMADVIEELTSFVRENDASNMKDQIDISESPSIQQLKDLSVDDTRPGDSRSKTRPGDSRSQTKRSVSESFGQNFIERDRLTIVPKGLRSFDQNDREFFLKLLPGPTDRHGVPESIRFWISRLDQTQQIEEVNVGIIYGPSGCGKSSFVRAGLIPRLSDCVIPIYVDCTHDDLTGQIVRQIRNDVHAIPANISLVELLQDIRRGKHVREGDKLLLVLDQFEQWLNGNVEYAESELTNALRQCDSKSIQALVLLRDEFWLSASQFMKCLDQRIEESHNAMALPLFDQRHARRVLAAFGRAHERLPDNDQKLSSQQNRFIKEAVNSLSNRGKVICVHLAVFAETAKNQPWNYSDLKSMGGWEGLGREFISGIFQNPETPSYIKKNSAHAWAILQQLLPASETELKGKTVSGADLQVLAGLAEQSTKFDELMDFLKIDSNLISTFENTDAIHHHKDLADDQVVAESLFGLTHDFLVKPIRSWGMAKQNETRQGRANVLLANLSDQWSVSSSDRYLPSDWDFGRILLFGSRSSKQQHSEFWARSQRRALKRGAFFGSILVLFLASIFWFQSSSKKSEYARIVQNYLSCEPNELEEYAQDLTPILGRVDNELRDNLGSDIAKRRTRAAAALLRLDNDQPDVRQILITGLAEVSPVELAWHQQLLAEQSKRSIRAIDAHINSDQSRLTPRLAIVSATLGESKWLNQISRLGADPMPRLDTIDEISECYLLAPAVVATLEQMSDQFDPDTISCFCCGLSQIDNQRLAPQDQNRCKRFLINQYQESPNGAVHVGSHYALSSWKLEIPEIPVGTVDTTDWCELRLKNPKNEQVPHRILFVKIGPGSFPAQGRNSPTTPVKQTGVVASEYWIAAFEIPQPLFQEFYLEKFAKPHSSAKTNSVANESRAVGPFNVAAANDVSPDGAVAFIEWMNSNRDQFEWINRPADFPDLEFALPSPDEFELATRAKSETDYFFGNASRAGQYVGKGINTFGLTSGQFLPNGFGIHDASANLSEWVDSPTVMKLLFASKGVEDSDTVDHMTSEFGTVFAKNYTTLTGFGFRIVMRESVKEKAQSEN